MVLYSARLTSARYQEEAPMILFSETHGPDGAWEEASDETATAPRDEPEEHGDSDRRRWAQLVNQGDDESEAEAARKARDAAYALAAAEAVSGDETFSEARRLVQADGPQSAAAALTIIAAAARSCGEELRTPLQLLLNTAEKRPET